MSASGQNSLSGFKNFPVRSICVLIVDDQRIMRTALRRLLEVQPSFKVCGEAHDGQEAVQKAIVLKP